MVKIVKGASSEAAINSVVEYVKNGTPLPENIEYSAEIDRLVKAFEFAKESKQSVINDVTSTLTGAASSVGNFLKNAAGNITAPSTEKERLVAIESRLDALEKAIGIPSVK